MYSKMESLLAYSMSLIYSLLRLKYIVGLTEIVSPVCTDELYM